MYDLTYCACTVIQTRAPVHPHNRERIAFKEWVKVNVRVRHTSYIILHADAYLPTILESFSARENERGPPFYFRSHAGVLDPVTDAAILLTQPVIQQGTPCVVTEHCKTVKLCTHVQYECLTSMREETSVHKHLALFAFHTRVATCLCAVSIWLTTVIISSTTLFHVHKALAMLCVCQGMNELRSKIFLVTASKCCYLAQENFDLFSLVFKSD